MQFDPPIGSIIAFAGPGTPDGYLLCDGHSYSKSAPYDSLFAVIGTSWGGDGVTNFNVPDLRGLFLRGADLGRGQDPDAGSRTPANPGGHSGDQVGTFQADALHSHSHDISPNPHQHDYTVRLNEGGVQYASAGGDVWAMKAPAGDPTRQTAQITLSLSGPTQAATASETRPKNASVQYLIRYM